MNSHMLAITNFPATMPDPHDQDRNLAMYGTATENYPALQEASERDRIAALSMQPSGTLRAILYESDPEIRACLRSLIAADSTLTLAAEPRTWPECQAALEETLPELFILRPELMPPQADKPKESTVDLPVAVDLASPLLGMGRRPQPTATAEVIRRTLDHALQEVYSRKVKQLAYLIRQYLSAPKDKQRYPSLLNVECDGHLMDVDIDDITAVVARRKHVSIHSTVGHFVLREPMGIVAGKLDPVQFSRIHRSIFVSIRHLDIAASSGDHAVLEDGASFPVGPSYRASFTKLLLSRR